MAITNLNSRKVKLQKENFTARTDSSSTPNTTYVGCALIASDPADPVWQIQRIDNNNGDVVILWANGNDSFTNIWDNRTGDKE